MDNQETPQAQPAAAPTATPPTPAPVAAPTPPQQPKKGLFGLSPMIIGAGLLVVAAIVGLAVFTSKSVSLEKYEGDGYSIMAPAEYEEDESTYSTTFTEKLDDDADREASTVAIQTMQFSEYTSREDIIKSFDQQFGDIDDDDDLGALGGTFDDGEIKNIKKSDDKHQGFEARRITADGYEDGKKVGSIGLLIVFGDDAMYMVMIAAHADSSLPKSVNTILDSFAIDED